MNCSDTQYLVHAYIDGELDIVKSLEIESHLKDCPACCQSYNNLQALRTAIERLYRKPSQDLQRRIKSSLSKADEKEERRFIPASIPSRWIGMAASLALLLIAGLALTRLISNPSTDELLAHEIVASHVRSLMADHLTDVPSSDQHTVKPWFNGKLDFSPPVQDFAGEGFPIVGGRLDYLNNRPVAAVVYQRRQHLINLFIWPVSDSRNGESTPASQQGYNLIHWTKAGNNYWCISDLNKDELLELVKLLKTS